MAEISGVDPAKIVIAHDIRASFTCGCAFEAAKNHGRCDGDNGKTSISSFCRQIWTELEKQAVNIGTAGSKAPTTPLRHTTPYPNPTPRIGRGEICGHHPCRDGASSHELDQRRLDGVRIKAAGFTGTQDHLDYHKTFDAYFQAKAGLFDRVLPDDGYAVSTLMILHWAHLPIS